MPLQTEPHAEQEQIWPSDGRHILAQYDDETVVVYQSYRPAIGRFAAEHGYFGGDFSLSRMSWIKPNFLWMMYRSGWGSKDGQEVVLAVRLRREAFDEILARAVPSSYWRQAYESEQQWKAAVTASDVRLQWDPDHAPRGGKLERRAIQLGLRGAALKHYVEEWIVEIEDVCAFVAEQRRLLDVRRDDELLTPRERVYPVTDPEVAARLGMEMDR